MRPKNAATERVGDSNHIRPRFHAASCLHRPREPSMKRFCFLAVLIALSSSADARSISFNVGSRRVHIESSRHCRWISCASMSISRNLDRRRKRGRNDDARDAATPAKPVPAPPPQTVSPPAPPAPPATKPPGPDHRRRAAAGRLRAGRIVKPGHHSGSATNSARIAAGSAGFDSSATRSPAARAG